MQEAPRLVIAPVPKGSHVAVHVRGSGCRAALRRSGIGQRTAKRVAAVRGSRRAVALRSPVIFSSLWDGRASRAHLPDKPQPRSRVFVPPSPRRPPCLLAPSLPPSPAPASAPRRRCRSWLCFHPSHSWLVTDFQSRSLRLRELLYFLDQTLRIWNVFKKQKSWDERLLLEGATFPIFPIILPSM